jgi:hypothetical protein
MSAETKLGVLYKTELLTTGADIGFARETMRSGICVFLRVAHNVTVTALS